MGAIQISQKEFAKIVNKTVNQNISSKKGVYMRNKLSDLNNYLFEQLERLNDDSLSEEEFKKEVSRAKAVSSVASSIVGNANVVLKASKYLEECGYSIAAPKETLNMLGMKDDD